MADIKDDAGEVKAEAAKPEDVKAQDAGPEEAVSDAAPGEVPAEDAAAPESDVPADTPAEAEQPSDAVTPEAPAPEPPQPAETATPEPPAPEMQAAPAAEETTTEEAPADTAPTAAEVSAAVAAIKARETEEARQDAEAEEKPKSKLVVKPKPPPKAPVKAPEPAPEEAPEKAPEKTEAKAKAKPKARAKTRTRAKPAAKAKAAKAATKEQPAPEDEAQNVPAPSADGKSERKVALVTGASGGIGEAFARVLAAEGYALVLVARSDGELNRVAGWATAEFDLPVATVPVDLTKPGAVDEVQKAFDARNITPEIIVNNAGFGLNGPAGDLDRDRQKEMIDLNIRTLTDLSLRFLPAMRERGRGGIINIASTAAFLPGPFMAVYYATKAYVLSFSEALSNELKGTGITVTAVCPGPVATGFQEEAGMQKAVLVKLFPMMTAEEVAETGYKGFEKGRRVVIPGLMNKIIAWTSPFTPNFISLPVVRFLQGPR